MDYDLNWNIFFLFFFLKIFYFYLLKNKDSYENLVIITLMFYIYIIRFIIGDFNEFMLPSEQRGGNFNKTRTDVMLGTMDMC